jgi:hypothetical protein
VPWYQPCAKDRAARKLVSKKAMSRDQFLAYYNPIRHTLPTPVKWATYRAANARKCEKVMQLVFWRAYMADGQAESEKQVSKRAEPNVRERQALRFDSDLI